MQEQFRLIVVENEKLQLEALCSLLEEAGFQVTGFVDPALALMHLKQASCDVILSDSCLPGMDGISLIQRVKQIDPDISAVLMTGNSDIKLVIAAMRLGVLDYISKPFTVSEITSALHRAIEVRALKRKNSSLIRNISCANAKLLETNEELDHFAGRVAHDLNSLCHIIQGFAGSLTRRASDKLDEQELRYLQRINEASARGGQLVADLLMFARLGSGDLQYSEVALDDVVEKARANVEVGEDSRQVEWSVAKLPEIQGDESLLEQVFMNLFSNAIKFSQVRSTPCISVEAQVQNGLVEVSVIDNGAGFDPDRSDGLFKPFYRLHNSHDFAGHGMGLANVKRIVERHGGRVGAKSAPGKGATFILTLPLNQQSFWAEEQAVLEIKPEGAVMPDEGMDIPHMELLSACIEHLNDIVIITDAGQLDAPGPHIVYVNAAFERVTGYHRNEVIGKSPRILQGPETDPLELAKLKKALQTRQTVHVDLVNYSKSGKPYWLEMDVVPVVRADGSLPYFASIQRDVTLRRQAEEHLKRSEALQRIGGRLAKLGAWAIDLGPVPKLYWSEEVFDILDIPKGKLPASYEDALSNYHGIWQTRMQAVLAKCAQEGISFELEPEMVSGTGRRLWARIVGEAVRDGRGNIVLLQGAVQDITESKVATRTLEHMNNLLAVQLRLGDMRCVDNKTEHFFREVCRVFCLLGGLPLAWACRFEDEGGDLVPLAVDGPQQAFISRLILPCDPALVVLLRSETMYVCQNIRDESKTMGWHQQAMDEGLDSFVILPVCTQGCSHTALMLFGVGENFFTNEVCQLLKAVAKNVASVIGFEGAPKF